MHERRQIGCLHAEKTSLFAGRLFENPIRSYRAGHSATRIGEERDHVTVEEAPGRATVQQHHGGSSPLRRRSACANRCGSPNAAHAVIDRVVRRKRAPRLDHHGLRHKCGRLFSDRHRRSTGLWIACASNKVMIRVISRHYVRRALEHGLGIYHARLDDRAKPVGAPRPARELRRQHSGEHRLRRAIFLDPSRRQVRFP